jgi:hypothetical protein
MDNPPICQCGTQTVYVDRIDKLVCPNKDCIKKRMRSVMSTLSALDRIAKQKEITCNLYNLAKQEFDRLTAYVETCNIKIGAELITLGHSFDDLGELGKQLGLIIDTLYFEVDELSAIAGSDLLENFTIKVTELTSNQRNSVLEINTQLGIDGTIFLAQSLYTDYLEHRNYIMDLMNYLTLVRPARLKRSAEPVGISYMTVESLFDELQLLSNLDDAMFAELVSITAQPSSTPATVTAEALPEPVVELNEEEEERIEELLDW